MLNALLNLVTTLGGLPRAQMRKLSLKWFIHLFIQKHGGAQTGKSTGTASGNQPVMGLKIEVG